MAAYQPVKEISLRQAILTIRHYAVAGLRGWPWIVAGLLAGALLLFWTAHTTPVRYEARIGFVVNDSQAAAPLSLGGVLGQISGTGGGGGGGNLQRIRSFVISRQLINQVLLETVTLDGREDLVANHLIRTEELVERFELDPAYGATTITADTLALLDRRERSLLKLLYNYLLFSPETPVRAAIDEITIALKVIILTRNEDLSLYLAESFYRNVTEFYTDEATKPAQHSVERLEQKADTLLDQLNTAEYQLAAFGDTQLSLLNRRDRVRSQQLQRKITVLATAYGEIVRNLEAARFTLDATMPYFKLVETPFTPLNQRRKDPVENTILGAALGGALGFLVAVLLAFYRDTMNGAPVPSEPSSPNAPPTAA